MDEDSAERAKRYRANAQEILAAAGDIKDPQSRMALLRLAETYERLAARIESECEATKYRQK